VPVAAAFMVVISILAWTKVDVVWSRSTVSGGDKWTAITQLMTAIGVGWGITWLTWSSDYTRFIKPGTPERKVFWSTSLAIFVPTVWLAFVGASVASATSSADPAAIVTAAFGTGVSIIVLFVVMHGPVATNILNLYSASLAALSLDIKVKRWVVSLIVSIVGTGMLVVFIESNNFASDFDKWLASVVVWISAWGGVMLVDYFLFRRGRIDVQALYADPKTSIYGDVNWAAVIAAIAGLVAGWAWEYGLIGFMQGPLAKATNNTDLSWLTAFVVSGGLYYALRPFLSKEGAAEVAPTH
jgi:purine-cytosine permease-like protein